MPKRFKLSETGDRGWFIGGFERAALNTTAVEAAYQFNYKGEHSSAHYHKIATEVNLIIRGCVVMDGQEFRAGDGYIYYPGDVCSCDYLEDTETMVIKLPGPLDDKYLV